MTLEQLVGQWRPVGSRSCIWALRRLAVLLWTLPAVLQAGYNYTIDGGQIIITGYAGPGGVLTLPSAIDGLPVTSIGNSAFSGASLTCVTIPDSVTNIGDHAFGACSSLGSVMIGNHVTSIGGSAFTACHSLASVTIPDSVTCIGNNAFEHCLSLTAVTIGNHVTSIGQSAFGGCLSLASVTIPDSVTTIGDDAFEGCWGLSSITLGHRVTTIAQRAFSGTSLASITIPDSVTSIGDSAFADCAGLTGVYFQGNPPILGSDVFDDDSSATVYHLPGTTGWGPAFAGLPTALWLLPNPCILNHGPNFGAQTNGFGFISSWATNGSVVVEASTNLANPTWSPVATNTLMGGSVYFSDPSWRLYPARFYRLRSP